MDTSGFSQVGRYGTICLMKRNESNAVVTAFGIDTEELTFGRDPACSVRLYYPDVSLVHCKVVFQERKAFLVVLGINGLLVDGCKVYANSSASSTATPTTIPLSNNSEFEIHGKRFRFSYPPKELRAALMATPARPDRRALRLSMIHSAQVFSPRPSQDPRENLRILRSPLKNTFKSFAKDSPSPLKAAPFAASSRDAYASPTKPQPLTEGYEEEDHIILVDGHHPCVVEEDKDLVILEDVEIPRIGSSIFTPTPTQQSHRPQQPRYMQSPQVQPQTPPRPRSLSRNTLHRAVLIRSAQRAVLKAESAEREREEEEEEMEVLGAVAADSESDDDVVMHYDVPDGRHAVEREDDGNIGDDDEENDEDDVEEEYDDEEAEEGRGRGRTMNREAQKSVWRKSLERIWPFRGSSPSKEEIDDDEEADNAASDSRGHPMLEDQEDKDEYAEDENQDSSAPLPVLNKSRAIMQTPVRRTLGSFMTPQVRAKSLHSNAAFPQAQDVDAHPQPGRYSLGGGEARRVVRAEQIWRVKDIVVPSMTANRTPDAGSMPTGHGALSNGRAIGSPAYRQVIGDEERKAIQERRRSALRQVDTFFAGGVPGMGPPSTPARALQAGSSPIKSSMSSASTSNLSSAASPLKHFAAAKLDDKDREDDEQVDTRSLLEKMKETVEGMKRRRSMVPATPVRGGNGPGLGPGGLATPARVGPTLSRAGFGRGVNSNTTDGVGMAGVPEVDENEKSSVVGAEEMFFNDREVDSDRSRDEREVFSLLRPGVLDEVMTRDEEPSNVPDIVLPDAEDITPSEEREEAAPTSTVPLPVAAEDDNEIDVAPKRGSGARFLRATRPSPSPAPPEDGGDDDNLEDEPMDQSMKPNTKGSKSRSGTRRPKTPQPQTPQEVVEAEENEPEPALLTRSTTRRARKPTAEPEPAENRVETAAPAIVRRSRRAATAEPEELTVAAAPAARRGRKAIAKPEVDAAEGVGAKKGRRAATVEPEEAGDVITPLPTTMKRGVRRVATPASDNEVAEEPQSQPPVRRGRTPRAAAAPAPAKTATAKGKSSKPSSSAPEQEMKVTAPEADVVHDDDEDPLDSIDQDEAESSAAVSKPKGRKKAALVKEEAKDETTERPPPATRVVKAKTAAQKTPAARARGTAKKTPATAPAAIPQGVDKENTPGSEESSGVDPEESAKVKVKVSRTTKRATSGTTARSGKVKEEMEMTAAVPEPEVSRPKIMRATRARTRT